MNAMKNALLVFIAVLLASCGGGETGSAGKTGNLPSSAKAITVFSLNNVNAIVNETNKSIAVTLPFGTNVTSLIASFTTSGAGVKVGNTPQVSGSTPNDFSHPVFYAVTAEDGTSTSYAVTVMVAANSDKAITAFTLAGATGAINEANKTIAFILPSGTNVTGLVATFLTTGTSVKVGTISQVSGVTQNDFSVPVTYIVSAADGTEESYQVTVAVAASSAKTISAFILSGIAGTIDEANKTIAVTLPYGANLTAVIASFNTTGSSVRVGATPQISGSTQNNFTTPLSYTVTAQDGTTAIYLVTVTRIAEHYSAVTGGCVKDNGTGLIWEVKTADGGLRDKSKTYTNLDSINLAQKWNGSAFVVPTQAEVDAATNTLGYVAAVNSMHLCGYSNWRVPTNIELSGIVGGATEMNAPNIDAAWFPNTVANVYWTSSPNVSLGDGAALVVDFGDYGLPIGDRSGNRYLRLVR